MWFARFQFSICEPQTILHKLLVLSWLYPRMVWVGPFNSKENKHGKPRGLLGFPSSVGPGYRAALFLGREGTTARSRLDLSTPKGMHQGYAPVHLWSGLDSAHVGGGVLINLFLLFPLLYSYLANIFWEERVPPLGLGWTFPLQRECTRARRKIRFRNVQIKVSLAFEWGRSLFYMTSFE